ncbi:MAG: RNA polymerase sigma factor [Saprospiraceae bacterium]|nr:RNA polymerase sigma factor [Saprospiraceae bacterium]
MKDQTSTFWEELYRNNIGTLIAVCYRYTGNRPLSEDLAHEAFLKAIDRIDSYAGTGSTAAWLRRITINHALQYLRDEKRSFVHPNPLPGTDVPDLPDQSSATHGLHDLTEQELLAAINELPEHHRMVFNLYVLDHFTHRRIAKVLGISPGTSKSHLARARKKLQQLVLEKATSKQEKSRQGVLIFLLNRRVDGLFRRTLRHFRMLPQNSLMPTLQGVHFSSAVPSVWSSAHVIGTLTAIGLTGMVVLTILHPFRQNVAEFPADSRTVLPVTVLDPGQEKNPEQTEEASNQDTKPFPLNPSQKDNRTQTATFHPDRVMINENLKQLRMKNLKSFSSMFLAASSLLFNPVTTPAQNNGLPVSEPQPIEAGTHPSPPALNESAIESNGTEAGTFTASKLFWSNEDRELYFRGRVKVDVENNHFSGEGDFKFLGPVQLLIFNGKKVKLGSYLTLVDHLYKVYRLSAKEAKAKYGEAGEQGAIEIQITE